MAHYMSATMQKDLFTKSLSRARSNMRTFVNYSLLFFLTVFLQPTAIAQTERNQKSRGVKNSSGGIKQSINSGKKIYATYCLSCHQEDGGGVSNMNPPLTQT